MCDQWEALKSCHAYSMRTYNGLFLINTFRLYMILLGALLNAFDAGRGAYSQTTPHMPYEKFDFEFHPYFQLSDLSAVR